MASDYSFETDVLRGQMARQLASNAEQFVFVLTDALVDVDIDDAIEMGQLGDTAENYPTEVVTSLRLNRMIAAEEASVTQTPKAD